MCSTHRNGPDDAPIKYCGVILGPWAHAGVLVEEHGEDPTCPVIGQSEGGTIGLTFISSPEQCCGLTKFYKYDVYLFIIQVKEKICRYDKAFSGLR